MLLGLVLIGLAAVSWGTTGATMTVLARDTGAGPLLVGWARVAIAATCLLAAAVAARVGRRAGAAPAAAAARSRPLGAYALLGLAMAGYQVCYFRAVTLSGVAATALLAICSAPVLIALLAAAVLRERLERTVMLSLLLAVVGTALLVVGPRGLADMGGRFGRGALLALGAGLCYAAYAVTAKGVLRRTDPLRTAAITFALAALFLAPVLVGDRASAGDLRAAAPLLLYLGIGPTAAAYALFTAGLRRVPATMAGIVGLLEPLTAALLGVAVFGEALGALGWTGAVLLLAALAVLASGRAR
jgi:DME family drug/metabolite transporter